MTDSMTGGEASAIQRRLAQELFDKAFTDFRYGFCIEAQFVANEAQS